jgi:hypothetical protein
MKALIGELMQKADLSEEQAAKVAGVVREFLIGKLPDALHGPLEAALTGEHIDSAFDAAKSVLGGLFK